LGDKLKFVDFEYCKKLTAVNAINLASIAKAPSAPKNVGIGGIVEAAAKLSWKKVKEAKGYKIYWRDTTSPTWDHFKYVENVTEYIKGIVVDNFFFGVAAVGKDGTESMVSFPSEIIR